MRFLSAKAYGFAPYVPVFAEGAPAFPGSFLSEGFHVQLAVRDTDLIGNVDVVPAGFLGPASPPPRAAGAPTANAVSPVVDPEDAGETNAPGTFENASDGDLADDIRRAAQPAPAGRQVGPEPTPARLTLHRHGRWTPTWPIGRRYCVIAHWL